MKPFEYIDVSTVDNLPEVVKDRPEQAVLLAGGTDLLDRLKERLIQPRKVVNIKNIPELRGIRLQKGKLVIGATTTIAEIAENKDIRRYFPVLAQAAESIGTPQLRNMGTIGGNLCQRPRCWYFRGREYHCLKKGGDICYAAEGLNKYHAILGGGPCFIVHPSDAAPALMALKAELEIWTLKGEKMVPIEQFFQLPQTNLLHENILQPGEILKSIYIPLPGQNTRSIYLKMKERPTSDFALSSVALLLQTRNGMVNRCHLILGGVAPIPWKAKHAEKFITGKLLNEDNITRTAEIALNDADPLTQNEYKILLTKNLIKKAFKKLMD